MNLLKVLYVLLQTRSTGKTAARLGISASAVSHALARLRDALSDPLFKREGNQQVPTPYALMLKDRLVPVFVSLNEELFGAQEEDGRHFQVVLPPALNVLLTPTLAAYGNRYRARVICLPFERRAWREELLDSRVDLVVSIGDHQKQISALQFERVGATRLIAIYGEPLRAQLQAKSLLSFSELAQFAHFYCHPWAPASNELDRQQARAGLERPLKFVCQDYAQLAPAVRSAPLMAIAPQPWFESLGDPVGLYTLPLDGERSEGSVFLQYRASTVEWKMKMVAAVRSALRAHYHD